MTRLTPLTRLGSVVLGACLLSYLLAVVLDWREFAALSVGFGLALLVAVPFVAFGSVLKLDRELSSIRVEVGRSAASILTVTNAGRRRTSPRVVEDRFGDSPWHHDVPALGVGQSSESRNPLPTSRRGIVDVGPATIVKTDPFGLLRRSLGQTDVARLWIYPRSAPLASLRSGFAKDLEGPTSDTSPAGDVAFHTIREYQAGDDVRHVHWLSTAKTGTLMVRHYVDNRRPYLGVLVDADPNSMSGEAFERALEIAASQLRSAEVDGRPVAVSVGSQEVLTPRSVVDLDSALDRLCLSKQDDTGNSLGLVEWSKQLRIVAPEMSALLVVTGSVEPSRLIEVVQQARRHGRVVVARVVPEGTEPVALPGAKVVDCRDLEGFVIAWRQVVG